MRLKSRLKLFLLFNFLTQYGKSNKRNAIIGE